MEINNMYPLLTSLNVGHPMFIVKCGAASNLEPVLRMLCSDWSRHHMIFISTPLLKLKSIFRGNFAEWECALNGNFSRESPPEFQFWRSILWKATEFCSLVRLSLIDKQKKNISLYCRWEQSFKDVILAAMWFLSYYAYFGDLKS